MKKILSLSLGLLMALSFTGCKNKETKFTEPKTPGEYSYNGKGHLESRITYNSNYGSYGPISRTDIIYDENNNGVFYYIYSYDSEAKDASRLTQVSEIKYENGKKVSVINYIKNDEKVRRSSKLEYKYDGDKLKTIVEYYANSKDGSFYKYSNEEYAYDEKGNIKTITHQLVKDSNIMGISNYIYEYTYDTNDRVIKTLFKTKARSKDEWSNTESYEYTYDSNGNTLTEIMESHRGAGDYWIKEYKKEYTYDSNNNETLVIEYDYDHDWIEYSKEETIYDSNNNKINYKCYRMGDMGWSIAYENKYVYENNRIASEDHLNGEGSLFFRYVYTYKEYN